MKAIRISFALLLSMLFLVYSCKKDDDDDNDEEETSGYQYSFKEQDLQGKINGVSFNMECGTYEQSMWDSTEYSLDFYALPSDSPCGDYDLWDGDKVFFSCPSSVGLYELSLSFSGESQTITMLSDETTLNIIASQGAIEILEVEAGVLKGRIDAFYDDDSYVNGNFTLELCE